MSDKLNPAKTAFRTHEETSTIGLEPDTVLKPGTVSVSGGVLNVKNEQLAHLIESKLAAASQLAAGRTAAADADVSVSVKVHF